MKIPKIDERQKKGVGEGTTIFRGGGGEANCLPCPPPKKIPCMVGMK